MTKKQKRDPNELTKAQARFVERLKQTGETIFLDLSDGHKTVRRSGGSIVDSGLVDRIIKKSALVPIAHGIDGSPMQWGAA